MDECSKELPVRGTSEVSLIVPLNDVAEPVLSIVIPALNEEITIERFIEWCKVGIATAGIAAEILIIDSSTDSTAEKAVACGARVLKTPKRGLGRAYIDAIPYIRGPFVLMGETLGSVRYWHGKGRSQWARDWVKLWTHGEGVFAMTNMESQSAARTMQTFAKLGMVDGNMGKC